MGLGNLSNGIRIFIRWFDQGVLAVGFIFYEKVAINEGRAIALSLTGCGCDLYVPAIED